MNELLNFNIAIKIELVLQAVLNAFLVRQDLPPHLLSPAQPSVWWLAMTQTLNLGLHLGLSSQWHTSICYLSTPLCAVVLLLVGGC